MTSLPNCASINNCNFLYFDSVNVLQQFLFQENISRHIGTDLSTGVEYRPLLNNNVIFTGGVSSLLPGRGFHDIYDPVAGRVGPMVACFVEMSLVY